MVHKSLLGALILAMLCVQPWSGAMAEEADVHEWGRHGDESLHEGAIVIEAQDGTRKVLGGQLGKETVDGVNVGLFVLQASNPERLKPGAKGPTHIFNVAFVDQDGGRMLADVTGTVVIVGAATQQRLAMRPFKSHYQVRTRLEQPGDYLLNVEFAAGDRAGSTRPVLFTYRRKSVASQAGHSQSVK